MDKLPPLCDLTPGDLGPIVATVDLWMCHWAWPFLPDGHPQDRKVALHSHDLPQEGALILASAEDPVFHIALSRDWRGREAEAAINHEFAHAICFDLFPDLMFGDVSVDRAEAAALVIEMLAPSTFPAHADCRGQCTSGYYPARWHVFPAAQQQIALNALRASHHDFTSGEYPALVRAVLEGRYGG